MLLLESFSVNKPRKLGWNRILTSNDKTLRSWRFEFRNSARAFKVNALLDRRHSLPEWRLGRRLSCWRCSHILRLRRSERCWLLSDQLCDPLIVLSWSLRLFNVSWLYRRICQTGCECIIQCYRRRVRAGI